MRSKHSFHNDTMRVLHFFKTALPDSIGGIEQVIDQIARGTARFGVKTDVLSLADTGDSQCIEYNGYDLHRAKRDFQIASTGFSFSALRLFGQLVKTADVVHYHFPWPFMDMAHFMIRPQTPTLVTYHSDIIRQKQLLKIYRPLEKRFLSDVNHIVATSPNYLASSNVLSQHREKVSIIPIGLDKNSYPEPSEEKLHYWRNRVGDKFFLFVGVIRYYKGLHILVEAAKGTNFPIVIVGAGPIGEELKAQAARLGVTNIQFLGYLPDDDKVALLKLSYAVLFPSHLRSEAFGISLLEGAMYGKPMISSEIGTGTTFINVDQETGVVVPPANPDALRTAMQYLWGNTKEASLMGKQAEKRYWDLFTADTMATHYVNVYQSLVEKRKLSSTLHQDRY